jgi:hypothetical protein
MEQKLHLAFSEADWERVTNNWQAWWDGKLDRPMVVIECIDPVYRRRKVIPGFDNDMWNNLAYLPVDFPIDTVLDNVKDQLEATRWYGDAFPKWYGNFGPGIIAAFLGALAEANTETTWFHPLEVGSLEEMTLRYDSENFWWNRLRAFTEQATLRWSGQVTFAHFDMVGCLDILAALRETNKLLVDTIENPAPLAARMGELVQLWLRYYWEYYHLVAPHSRGFSCWGPIWFPGPGYYLQCDFAYMISPRMFKRFVMPELEACCAALEFPFYHLDGKGQIAHLDHLLSLERLRGIQWVPGDGAPPPEDWPEILKRIRQGNKLCQVFTTRQGALKIIREQDGGKGFILKIEEDLEESQVEVFFRQLEKEGGWTIS